jgi:hypothetical protein
VQKRKIPMLRLPRPLHAQNVDGTHNSGGVIRHKISIFVRIGDAEERREFLVLNCGKENMILGLPWLRETNPTINWASGEVHIPSLPRSPRHDSPRAVAQCYLVRYLDLDPDKKIAQLWKKRLNRYASEAYDVRGTQVTEEVTHDKTKVELPAPFKRFQGVFEKKNMEELPPPRSFDHGIDLDADFVPKVAKVYPLNPKEHEACRNFVDEHLATGKIQPSKSPQASPFFFVPKKDGSVRPYQDYRYVNSHTVKNAYPLPLISDLVDRLQGSHIFTKMDIRWGYNNVLIRPKDRWKAAFITPFGLFEPTVMFFGLCNSPTTFQALMDHLFGDFIAEGWLIIYMDDLLIHSAGDVEHQERTEKVLQRLQDNHLYLTLEKCAFAVPEVEYLGMVIKEGHMAMDPTKLTAIDEWQPQNSVKGVRSFIGFCNFYRRFIPDFSNIAHPLHDLTRKNAR